MSELVSKMFSRMSKMRPRPIEWAWEGLVPQGKLTLVTGDPGVGKSLVALQVAAMVTRGVTTVIPVPDGVAPSTVTGSTVAASSVSASSVTNQKRVSGKGVLVFSAAHLPEDTVLPRLMAAGADAFQVFFFKGYMVDEPADDLDAEDIDDEEIPEEATPTERPFLLSRDMEQVEWCLEELSEEGIDVGLIVIDSIDRYIGTSEKKSDRIEVVAQLADLAARSGAAMLVTANTSMKAGSRGGTVVYQELLNTARSVLMVAEDPQQPDRRLVLPVKHNLTARPKGVSFTVEQGVVRWGTESFDLAAADLRQSRGNPNRPLAQDDVHELDRAIRWLEDALRGGPVSSESIQCRAAQVDISYGTLRRASKILEIKVRKQKNQWFWSLPDQMERMPEEELTEEASPDLFEFLDSEDECAAKAGMTECVLV